MWLFQGVVVLSSTVVVRSKWELMVPIEFKGSKVSYKFSTKRGSIGFGIFFRRYDETEIVLKASERIPANVGSVSGTVSLPNDDCGFIYFEWDNSFSWLTSKDLTYHVELRYVSDLCLLIVFVDVTSDFFYPASSSVRLFCQK